MRRIYSKLTFRVVGGTKDRANRKFRFRLRGTGNWLTALLERRSRRKTSATALIRIESTFSQPTEPRFRSAGERVRFDLQRLQLSRQHCVEPIEHDVQSRDIPDADVYIERVSRALRIPSTAFYSPVILIR